MTETPLPKNGIPLSPSPSPSDHSGHLSDDDTASVATGREDDDASSSIGEKPASATGEMDPDPVDEPPPPGDSADDDEEGMTVEEKLEAERERVAQCKETITSLISQITAYRKIVEEEKERDKKKIAALTEQQEKLKALVIEQQQKMEQVAGEANEVLQAKIKQLTADLEQERSKTAELRVQTVANLKALQQDLVSIDQTNKTLNRELAEERAAHKQTIQQLWALKQKVESPALTSQDQEIRIRVVFDGNKIAQATLIPENDQARAALREENDFMKAKWLELQQEHNIMRSELEEAKEHAEREKKDAEKAAEQLKAVTATHTETLSRLDEAAKQRDVLQSQLASIQLQFNSKLKSDESAAAAKQTIVQKEALRIFDRYLIDNAELDIGSQLRKPIKAKIFQTIMSGEGLGPNLFEPVKTEVVQLLESDQFVRWLTTSTWVRFWKHPEKKPTFADMFVTRELRKDFQKFLEHEMAVENILFLIEVEEFYQMTTARLSSPVVERKHRHHKHRGGADQLAFSEDPTGVRKALPSSVRHRPDASMLSRNVPVQEAPPSPPYGTPSAGKPHVPGLPLGAVGESDEPSTSSSARKRPTSPEPVVVTRPPSMSFAGVSPRGLESTVATTEEEERDYELHRTISARGAGDRKMLRKQARFSVILDPEKAKESGVQVARSLTPPPKASDHVDGAPPASEPPPAASKLPEPLAPPEYSAVAPVSPVKPPITAAPSTVPSATAAAAASTAAPPPPLPPIPPIGGTAGQYLQNLQELVSEPAMTRRLETSLVVLGAVSYILPVKKHIWIANGASPSSIQVYDRQTCNPVSECKLESSITHMLLVDNNIWVASADKTLRYFKQREQTPRQLAGHTQGPIFCLAHAGRHVWSIAADQKIGIWDTKDMKLHRMVTTGSFMTCMANVNGTMWFGTSLGLVFYDTTTFKPIKKESTGKTPRAPPISEPETKAKEPAKSTTPAAKEPAKSATPAAKEPTKEPAKEPAKGTAKEPAKEPAKESAKGTAKEPAKEPAKKDSAKSDPAKSPREQKKEESKKELKKEDSKKEKGKGKAAEAAPAVELTEKQKEQAAAAERFQKMAVSKLLVVDGDVWVVHHDENLISIWDGTTRAYKESLEAKRVRDLIRLGPTVWTCSWDNCIRCWDIATLQFVRELTGIHDDTITSLAIAKSSRCLRIWSGSADHTVCIWNTDHQSHDLIETGTVSRSAVCAICNKTLWSLTGKIAACRVCFTFCVHLKCVDLIPISTICPGVNPQAEPGSKTHHIRKDSLAVLH